jgi:hypothetical protein
MNRESVFEKKRLMVLTVNLVDISMGHRNYIPRHRNIIFVEHYWNNYGKPENEVFTRVKLK